MFTTARKTQWTTALRSGLTQTTGRLCIVDAPSGAPQFCCIGVYGRDIMQEPIDRLNMLDSNIGVYAAFDVHMKDVNFSALMTYLQTRWPERFDFVFSFNTPSEFFWKLNDRFALTFDEIADVIDQIPTQE